jgi:hypothetical protein
MTVVSELVGLGEDHRSRMLEWAAASWDVQGPANERFTAAMPLSAGTRVALLHRHLRADHRTPCGRGRRVRPQLAGLRGGRSLTRSRGRPPG